MDYVKWIIPLNLALDLIFVTGGIPKKKDIKSIFYGEKKRMKNFFFMIIISMIICLLSAQSAEQYIGDPNSTTTYYYVPLNFFHRESVTQTIYLNEEISPYSGFITSIKYEMIVGDVLEQQPIHIYLANVGSNYSQFTSVNDWVPYSEFTLVYDGYFDFPQTTGWHIVEIPFDIPYLYQGGNLVIMAHRINQPENDNNSNQFKHTSSPSRTIYLTNNGSNPLNILNLPLGNGRLSSFPNITFYFDTLGLSIITGAINSGGFPVQGVQITLGIPHNLAISNSEGVYTTAYISSGEYTLTASKIGYQVISIPDFIITPDQVITQDFDLTAFPIVNISGIIIGSDFGLPIEGARISLSGYISLPDVFTNSDGYFLIPDIYALNTYTITINHELFQTDQVISFEVDIDDLDLGIIMINEITTPPLDAIATAHENYALISWNYDSQFITGKSDISARGKSEISATINRSPLFIFNIYRCLLENIEDESLWDLIGYHHEGNTYLDYSWATIEEGIYFYIIKAVYTYDVLSIGAITNYITSPNYHEVYWGDPTSTNTSYQYPVNYFYKNSITQSIYPQSELNTNGLLTMLTYRFTGQPNSPIPEGIPVQIYVGTTNITHYYGLWSSAWIPLENFTLVYDAPLPVTNGGTKDIHIPLSERFYYENGNIVIMMVKNWTAYYGNGNVWQISDTIVQNRTLFFYHDFLEADPTNYYEARGFDTHVPNVMFTFLKEFVTISGTITGNDTDGIGLADATITLIEDESSFEVQTNNQGLFVIPNVPSNKPYDITITHQNYYRYLSQITLEGSDDFTYDIELLEKTPPPRNVQANIIGTEAFITWTEPSYNSIWFSHSNEIENLNEIGIAGPVNMIIGHRYTPEQLENLGISGAFLSVIRFFPCSNNISPTILNSVMIKIYTGGSANPYNPGTLVYEQSIPLPIAFNQWYECQLIHDIPIPINEELWICIEFIGSNGLALTSTDNGPTYDGYGNIMWYNGQWQTLNEPLGNWAIYALAEGISRTERSLSGYSIYRALEEYINNESEWTLLIHNIESLSFTDQTWETLENGFYRYIVKAVYNGENYSTPAFSNIVGYVTETDKPEIPVVTTLKGNYPNPFNPSTIIIFDKSIDGNAKIDIYNIKGQKIKSLVNDYIKAGQHTIEWNGTDDNSSSVSSGIYFYRLETEEYVATRKMMILK